MFKWFYWFFNWFIVFIDFYWFLLIFAAIYNTSWGSWPFCAGVARPKSIFIVIYTTLTYAVQMLSISSFIGFLLFDSFIWISLIGLSYWISIITMFWIWGPLKKPLGFWYQNVRFWYLFRLWYTPPHGGTLLIGFLSLDSLIWFLLLDSLTGFLLFDFLIGFLQQFSLVDTRWMWVHGWVG